MNLVKFSVVSVKWAQNKRGQKEAMDWLQQATAAQKIAVAGSDFEYGETLADLIAEGCDVPRSTDVDFSWGFFKQVKSHVHHQLTIGRKESSSATGRKDQEP